MLSLIVLLFSLVASASVDWFEACVSNDLGRLKSIGDEYVNVTDDSRLKCHDYVWKRWHSSPPETVMPTLIWLVEKGATRFEGIFAKLCSKCHKNDSFKPFLLELVSGAPVNSFDFSQALCHAARSGLLSVVRSLVPHVEFLDDPVALVLPSGVLFETSPLEEAISADRIQTVKYLLTRPCYQYSKKPVLNFDPIKLAVMYGSRACLLHFVKLGYDTAFWDDLSPADKKLYKLTSLTGSIEKLKRKRSRQ